MSDVTAAPPVEQTQKILDPIWPRDISIPVIGCAGELNTGKTLFGLTIDPVNTICYDFEKSSESFKGLEFTRVDVPNELLKIHPNGYTQEQLFLWFRDSVRKIPVGKYSVLIADPVTDPEIGLVDYVKAHPAEFGKTAGQYERASGLLWGDVKNYWKLILLDFTSRFQTFYFTAHMRQVWKGSSPTSRREPQGKDTLAKLASLYILLNRDVDGKGNVPEKPRGRVLKDRLSHTAIINGEPIIQPILPPHLPEASPAAIRTYIIKPPNYEKLQAKEKVPSTRLSDDQRLELQAEIARDEVEAETMRASRFEQMESAANILHEAKQKKTEARTVDQQSAAKPTDSKMDAIRAQDAPPSAPILDSEKAGAELLSDAELAALKEEERLDRVRTSIVPAPPAALPDGSLNPAMLQLLKDQFTILELTRPQKTKACKKRGVEKIEDITPDGADELQTAMRAHIQERENKAGN